MSSAFSEAVVQWGELGPEDPPFHEHEVHDSSVAIVVSRSTTQSTMVLEEASPAPGRRGWKGAVRWLLMAASVFFLLRVVRSGGADVAEAVRQLAHDKAAFVVAAVILEAGWLWSLAQVYRTALIALGGRVGNLQALRVSTGAFALSRILPGGGAAGSVFAARELMLLGNSAGLTVASMVLSWWVSMVTLSAIVFVGIAVSTVLGVVPAAYLAAPGLMLIGLMVVGGTTSLALRNRRRRSRFSLLVDRVAARFGVSTDNVGPALVSATDGKGERLLPVSLWASAAWALDAATLWVMFAAFGYRVGIGPLLVGYGLVNLLQALPELTPGWLGILEASLAGTFTAFGFPAAVSVLAVLSYRLFSYWLPVAAGLPLGLQMLHRPGARPVQNEMGRTS